MFYSVAECNTPAAAATLRLQVAEFVAQNWENPLVEIGTTPKQLLSGMGWQKDQYLHSITSGNNHWGDEPELVFLSHIVGKKLRVFQDKGYAWHQLSQYGTRRRVLRLLFTPRNGEQPHHYDVIQVKEGYAREREVIEKEEGHKRMRRREKEQKNNCLKKAKEIPWEKKYAKAKKAKQAIVRAHMQWQNSQAEGQSQGAAECPNEVEGPLEEVNSQDVKLLVSVAEEDIIIAEEDDDIQEQGTPLLAGREKRVRHQTHWYQSQEEEERRRQGRIERPVKQNGQ